MGKVSMKWCYRGSEGSTNSVEESMVDCDEEVLPECFCWNVSNEQTISLGENTTRRKKDKEQTSCSNVLNSASFLAL